MSKLTEKEAWEIAQMIRPSLKIQNEIGFGDRKYKAPDIDIYPDDKQYYDSRNREIHLGAHGIVDLFGIQTEEEFLSAVNFVRGHEEQHCRSTASKPYRFGIRRGCEIVLEYISSREESSKRRFRSAKDYEEFADKTLPSLGIYVSWKRLRTIIAGIANSIEDGRIERIRASRFPGFEKLRLIHRAAFWEDGPQFPPWEKIDKNPGARLSVITNEILSLATCQLYNKGFISALGEHPVVGEIKEIMPHIGKGVMAKRTRDMSDQVVEISKKLAPLIYEVCKLSETEQEIRKFLDELIKRIMEGMLDGEPDFDLSETDEDEDENGSPLSTFPKSDLVITVPDEVFDRLSKNAKGKGEGGIMIKREHPKDDDKKENGSDSDSAGEHNKKDGSVAPEQEKSGKNNSGETDKKPESSHARVEGENADYRLKADEKMVKEAMEEAAREVNEKAKQEIDSINTHTSHAIKTAGPEIADTSKPVTAEDVKDICPAFIEVKRAYKLIDPLPTVLAARGKALLRKNQQYFKSLSTPNVSYLDSGSVDASRIYGLSFGDTEIFRKKGIDKKFDGCCYILLDNSGSMSGNKRTEACKATAVIEESFRGLIPIKIAAFDYHNGVIHEVIKGWDEQMRLNCSWNFCLRGRSGAGNADGYDIKIATKELMARPESKKLLIVLSDGMPAEASAGFTKGAIREARKKGIQVSGIYFEEGSIGREAKQFKEMYEKDYVCCELSDVDSVLSGLMKKFSRS